jgi:hypothetical protein
MNQISIEFGNSFPFCEEREPLPRSIRLGYGSTTATTGMGEMSAPSKGASEFSFSFEIWVSFL